MNSLLSLAPQSDTFRALAVAGMVVLFAGTAYPQDLDLDTIVEGMAASGSRLESGIFSYTVSMTQFATGSSQAEIEAGAQERIDQLEESAVRRGAPSITASEAERIRSEHIESQSRSAAADTFVERSVVLKFSGEKVWSSIVEAPAIFADSGNDVIVRRTAAYDGKTESTLQESEGLIGNDPVGYLNPIRRTEGELSRKDPRRWGRYQSASFIEKNQFSILREEDLDVGSCVVLESTYGTRRVWVCPEKDFLWVREEMYREGEPDHLMHLITLDEIDLVEGRYVPTVVTSTSYRPTDHEPSGETIFEYEEISLNVEIPDEEFRIRFPDKTQVTDRTVNPPQYYTIGEIADDLIDDLGADLDTLASISPEGAGGSAEIASGMASDSGSEAKGRSRRALQTAMGMALIVVPILLIANTFFRKKR